MTDTAPDALSADALRDSCVVSVLQRLIANYKTDRDEIADSDLDNEQPVRISFRGTLGDIRNAKKALAYFGASSAARPDAAATVSNAARAEIMRLMREDFDPTPPNWEGREWDDNAEDVADKIIAVALSGKPIHVSDAWRIVKRWLVQAAEEEALFSRYSDDVVLDGVMTAAEMRKLNGALDGQRPDAAALERRECAQIVREEWQRAVREFGLKPGSPTEAVTARIIERLTQ